MPTTTEAVDERDAGGVNEVRLAGRLSADPEERTLPSGDTVWTFRVVVPRSAGPGEKGSRQRVDVLECAVWSGRARRSVAIWRADDQVEVTGSMRRRFYRAGGSTVSRVEVAVTGARMLRRSASG